VSIIVVPCACAEDKQSIVRDRLTVAQIKDRLKKNPNDIAALLAQADYLARTRDSHPAMDAYNKVLKLAPNNMEALQNLTKLN
ncbi:hypothetical protein ABTH79_19695, partial [Acinetobacter baumannii]